MTGAPGSGKTSILRALETWRLNVSTKWSTCAWDTSSWTFRPAPVHQRAALIDAYLRSWA